MGSWAIPPTALLSVVEIECGVSSGLQRAHKLELTLLVNL